MTDTAKLVALDMRTIRAYLTPKTLLVFAAIAVFIGAASGSPAAMIGVIVALASIWVTYPFALAEKCRLDILYTTLSLGRVSVVRGRYVFALFIDLVAAVVGYLVAFAVLTLTGKDFDPVASLLLLVAMFVVFSLVQAVQFPLLFRFTYTKARFLVLLPLVGFPAVVLGITSLASTDIGISLTRAFVWLGAHLGIMIPVAILLWSAVIIGSYMISVRFYRTRDF